MLLGSDRYGSQKMCLAQFTNRHRPHLEEAFERHRASPFGIAQEGLGRR